MNKKEHISKQNIRSRYLSIRDSLSTEERIQKSRKIWENLKSDPIYQEAQAVLVYMDYRSEVMTTGLVEELLADPAKRVFAPKVEGMHINFYEIESLEELESGYQGIREPKESPERKYSHEMAKQMRTLILIPGSVFDRQRGRMGYGKGFYDRFLSGYQGIYGAALAFSCQIAKMVPMENHDKRPDMVVTENEIITGEKTMTTLKELGENAVQAKYELQTMSTEEKNSALAAIADALVENSRYIIEQNAMDIKNGEEKGMHSGFLDRLRLDEGRILGMAEGLKQVVSLPDPVGEVMESFERPNGLLIEKRRVPIGVIGIIYESRPNVTADAFGLCFKSGNAVILKGGSDAIHSNIAITSVIRKALAEQGITQDAIQLIESTDRAVVQEFMRLREYVDLLIPRGGAGLIRSVVEGSTIPVIETGTGNCHIYVDEYADLEKAIPIIINAKTQRIGVCNACESLVVHEAVSDRLLPALAEALKVHNVEIRGDEKVQSLIDCIPATLEDYGTEYLDYIISMKTVSSVDEAIAHINKYNTKHSETILTENIEHAEKFLREVDAACVYVNASTRFTDGFEFGFGAEIGISTQKLHARGPMGLKELTSYKYAITGNGQIR